MRIEVTAEDIHRGVRAGCYDCPVALAISRATGSEAHVFGNDVQLDGERSQTFRLPPHVTDRIDAYDDRKPMEPFGFALDLTSSVPYTDDEDDDQ